MTWQVKIADKAAKQIKKIPQKDAQRLLSVLESLSENPYQGDIEKIQGEENVWRRRIGNYRILYETVIPKRMTWVFDIRRKTTTTYR